MLAIIVSAALALLAMIAGALLGARTWASGSSRTSPP
jgi:hypothetical protein